MHISEIIETVVNLKPVVDEYYLIIIKINEILLENLKLFIKKSNQSIKEILEKKLEIKIFSSSIKNGTLYTSLNKDDYEKLEKQLTIKKNSVTKFFNNVLMDAISND